jgi:RecB family exonuclease
MLEAIKKRRVQSPTSINTYKQCPRKYYYQYIEKLPTLPNIHQVRGNIVHSVLENFFDIDSSTLTMENYKSCVRKEVQRLLMHHWNGYRPQLRELSLNPDQERFYFEETMLMLLNWSNHFINDMERTGLPVNEAFTLLTPIRERKYQSDSLYVQGFIDAIHERDGEVHLIDYKTNASLSLKDEQKLQLGIYSLLYQEAHGRMPDKVGIFFLRQKLQMIPVNEELLEHARQEIINIHRNTQSTDINDYPKKTSPLCKWSTGQCDFFDVCQPF